MDESCECRVKCPHGDVCIGGHASYPTSHWYPCEKCTPAPKTTIKEALAVRKRRRRKQQGR